MFFWKETITVQSFKEKGRLGQLKQGRDLVMEERVCFPQLSCGEKQLLLEHQREITPPNFLHCRNQVYNN